MSEPAVRSAPQCAYEMFIGIVSPQGYALPWDELPPYVREAWERVVESIKQGRN